MSRYQKKHSPIHTTDEEEEGFAQTTRSVAWELNALYGALSQRGLFDAIKPAYSQSGGSVAEWLACSTQAQKAWIQIGAATLSGNSLRQTVHTRRASVHQAAKLVAALLRVASVTAGLAESNGSLPPGL